MIKRIKYKLNSERGASILIILLLFIVCMMISATIISASMANASRSAKEVNVKQEKLLLQSVVDLFEHGIESFEYTCMYTSDIQSDGNHSAQNDPHSYHDEDMNCPKSKISTLGKAGWDSNISKSKIIFGEITSIMQPIHESQFKNNIRSLIDEAVKKNIENGWVLGSEIIGKPFYLEITEEAKVKITPVIDRNYKISFNIVMVDQNALNDSSYIQISYTASTPVITESDETPKLSVSTDKCSATYHKEVIKISWSDSTVNEMQ